MPLFRNLTGTSEDSFQLGIGDTSPIFQRVGTTARLQLPDLLRWLPGGSAVQGWISSDSSGDLTVVKSEFNKTVAPTVNDDGATGGYSIGSRWLDTTSNLEYVCLDDSTGAAIWKNTTASGSGSGDVVGPNSSIDYGMVVFNGITGKLIQDSGKRNYGGSATDPTTPAPADGDIYYNTVLDMWMAYDATRAKFLSIETTTFIFGRRTNTSAGSYYRGISGQSLSATIGWTAPHDGTVVGLGYTRSDSDSATFEVTADGTSIATLASTATSGKSVALDGDFDEDGVLAAKNQSGGRATTRVQGWFKVRWRV